MDFLAKKCGFIQEKPQKHDFSNYMGLYSRVELHSSGYGKQYYVLSLVFITTYTKLFKRYVFSDSAYPLFLAIVLRLLWLAKKTHTTGRHIGWRQPRLWQSFSKHIGGKAESRLNFELLRPTGLLQQQIYSSSSPDSSSP